MKHKTLRAKILVLFSLIASNLLPTPDTMAAEVDSSVTQEAAATIKLLITAVDFKNKEHDSVTVHYESNPPKTFNLKGFQFADDSAFKKIADDYILNSGEDHVLQFKSEEADDAVAHKLFSSRTGLTATTEQIVLKDADGKIFDAVCWTSDTPTADEIKDMQQLFDGQGWNSADPASCFPSANVGTNQTLVRVNLDDTNSMQDWIAKENIAPSTSSVTTQEILSPSPATPAPPPPTPLPAPTAPTPAASPASVTTRASTPSPAPAPAQAQIATPRPTPPPPPVSPTPITKPITHATTAVPVQKTAPPQKTAPSQQTRSVQQTQAQRSVPTSKDVNEHHSSPKKTTRKTAKKSAPKYTDGDLNSDIIISEIFPRPAKDQKKNEWIELTNNSDQDTKMGNWKLVLEGKPKTYTLPDSITIAAGKTLVIKAPDSKLSLNDTQATVQLFDPSGEQIDSASYQEAPKNQSYSRIDVENEDGSSAEQWLWDDTPTPAELNPGYQELTGTITKEPEFGQNYNFAVQTQDGAQHTVVFKESLIAGPLAQATFRNGSEVKILGMTTTNVESALAAEPNAEPNNRTQVNSATEFILKKFEVTKAAQATPQESFPWFLLALFAAGAGGIWYSFKRYKKSVLKS